jgi:hypothetical protein
MMYHTENVNRHERNEKKKYFLWKYTQRGIGIHLLQVISEWCLAMMCPT